MNQAIAKDERVHPIRDLGSRRVGSPFEKKKILHVDGLDAPPRLRQCLENTREEGSNRILATRHSIWRDEVSSISIVHHGRIQVFSSQSLGMVFKDLFGRPFREVGSPRIR